MDIKGKYNVRSPAVKRLMREAMELHEPTDQYFAQPLEDNIFEWHFTVRGAPDTDFADGRYHGRIILPPEYPMKPPSIILLTPNGRFEIGKKICLSMSAHHPETWQPSWSIRTVLLAIIGFMPSKGEGAIGALEYTHEERRKLAKKSQVWVCTICGSNNSTCLLEGTGNTSATSTAESMRIAGQITFKSAPEDKGTNKSVKINSSKNDLAVSEESANIETTSSAVMDGDAIEGQIGFDNEVTVNRCAEPNSAASLAASSGRLSQVSSEGDVTQVGQTPNSTDGVRKRVPSTSRDEVTKEKGNKTPVSKKESNGLFSLVLLWIVVLSLIVLIFRRLCMDALLIGGSK